VNFSFVNDLLEGSYCKYYGRPAKEPEMMAKLLILQYLYNYSDERVIQETQVNLAYMWFIGINPEDDLPHPSLLAKFRTQRLNETSLDDIIKEVVRQCVEKGIINGTGISIDCTHTQANTRKLVPERVMKHLAKKILKNIEQETGSIPDGINSEIPDYREIQDHMAAKQTMKDYLEKLITDTQAIIEPKENSKIKKSLLKAREILDSPKFIEQKGIRSLVDEEARVGHKSKTEDFFGYKVEFAMVPEESIITAVTVGNGSYVDGTEFKELYEITKACGIEIKEAYGDKAYFRKPILDILKEDDVAAYIPVSEAVYKLDESKYSYNKDSDQWFCEKGNHTVKKKTRKSKQGYSSLAYTFDKAGCQTCDKKAECIKGKTKARRIHIGINAPEFYEHSQWTKTEEFKDKYKLRARQEWKNGEMKRFHGMARSRGYGLRSMKIQAKLTALAVNLKRIAKLVSSSTDNYCGFIVESNVSLTAITF
ncbi:MAG: IS1182 family transposase, partial [Ignavibacteriales bacterium]